MHASRRLHTELTDAHRDQEPDIKLRLKGDNLFEWIAEIIGPPDSPYEGGRFKMRLVCASSYPVTAPSVTFLSPLFHPNISFKTGELCLDVLKDSWSPAWTLQSVCRAVIVLLANPNAESPLNCDAGNLLRNGDIRGFRSMAYMYTQEYSSSTEETEPGED